MATTELISFKKPKKKNRQGTQSNGKKPKKGTDDATKKKAEAKQAETTAASDIFTALGNIF